MTHSVLLCFTKLWFKDEKLCFVDEKLCFVDEKLCFTKQVASDDEPNKLP